MYDGVTKIWKEPAQYYDIVAVPLSKDFSEGSIVSSFSSEFLLSSEYNLSIGQDVFIVGYPLGHWYDKVHNLPVVRYGIIASAYPVPYNGNPYFLIDGRLHEGTSVAPVLTKPPTHLYKKETVEKPKKGMFDEEKSEIRRLSTNRFLLGINAATFPFPSHEQKSDLNAVYFASVIPSLTG